MDVSTNTLCVLANEDGHALAVCATFEEARDFAYADARHYVEGNEALAWTSSFTEAAPQWTTLEAALAHGQGIIARYVITVLPADGKAVHADLPDGQRRKTRRQLAAPPPPTSVPARLPAPDPALEPEDPAVPEPPLPPETDDSTPEPAAEPETPAEPPPVKDSEADPADVECEGRYDGCATMVETKRQLQISKIKQRRPLCTSCYKHEVANQIPPQAVA